MGQNPNGPRSVSCDRAIRYSGLGVRSLGPVGDFLEILKSWGPVGYYDIFFHFFSSEVCACGELSSERCSKEMIRLMVQKSG